MLFKNVSSQRIHVYAYDSTTGAAKTGDALNITAYVSLDGTANAVDDTNPAEVDATNMPGVYVFDLTQAETNCNAFALYSKSSTANIRIEPIIGFTTGTAVTQTGDSYAVVSNATYGNSALNTDIDAIKAKTDNLPASPASTTNITAASGVTVTTNNDKTGYALSATGGDLILKSSTFVQAITAAINELATYGLTALNTLLVTTGIKTATTAPPADMALNSTVAKEATLVTTNGKVDQVIAATITNAAGVDVAADIIALRVVADLIEDINRNRLEIDDATGAVSLKDDAGATLLTGSITDDLTTTVRTRLV